MSGEDDYLSKYFRPHKNEKYTLNEQDIKKDYKNLVNKSFEL